MNAVLALISEHSSPLPSDRRDVVGSQGLYVAHLARQLVRAGLSVDVFTRADSSSLPDTYTSSDGYRVVFIKAGPTEHIDKEDLFPFMPIFARNMFAFIQQEGRRYDLIHAHFWMSGWVGLQLRHQLNAPLVVSFHALGKIRRLYQGEHDHFPDERFTVEEQIARNADLLIAHSQNELDLLIDHYGVDPQHIAMIPCGLDPEEFFPLDKTATRRLLHLPENTPLVLSVGRLVRRKGFDNTIRGFACFRRISQRQAILVIVAARTLPSPVSECEELSYLQSIARDEGVSDAVRFTEDVARSELKFYYSAADVFVTTPWYEPFGMAPLEAMACGVPVIASAVGGLLSTISAGESGLHVPPRQPEELGHALEQMFANAEQREEMGQHGLRRVRRLYDWNRVCSQIVRAYSSVSASPTPLRQAG